MQPAGQDLTGDALPAPVVPTADLAAPAPVVPGRAVATIALALVALWAGVRLFPIDSDGAFAVNDGVHYASGAEHPRLFMIARHPLFHGLAWSLTQGLRNAGIEHPGHHAIRIIAGLGAAWLVVQITLLAGRRRWVAGWLCAAFALSCRYVLFDTAAGETLPIAAASSLLVFAIVLASRPRWVLAGAALVLSLLFRQDNALAIPALALVMWPSLPPARRWLRLAAFFAITGVLTLGGYVLMWRLNGREEQAFTQWLFEAAQEGSWGTGLTADRMRTHLSALSNAIVGDLRLWVGPALLAACAAGGLLAKGAGPGSGRFALAMLLTVVIRYVFHSWWAPASQFHVYNVAAVAAACSFAARSEAPRVPARVRAGLAIIFVLALYVFLWHWPSTRMYRERRVLHSVGYAAVVAPPGTHFYSPGTIPRTALGYLGVPATQLPYDWNGFKSGADPGLPAYPAMVVFDRFTAGNYHDAILRPGRFWNEFDALEPSEKRKLFRVDGLVVAVLILP